MIENLGGQQQMFAAENFRKLTTKTFEASLARDETHCITLVVVMGGFGIR